VGHLRENGFTVKGEDVSNLELVKARYGVPKGLAACHTAVVRGYVVEGHVPADTIERLLREAPPVTGVAVPGMPTGSPGMEHPGQPPERYRIFTFDKSGKTAVFENR
jgi:hypothetical protein